MSDVKFERRIKDLYIEMASRDVRLHEAVTSLMFGNFTTERHEEAEKIADVAEDYGLDPDATQLALDLHRQNREWEL